MLMIQHILGLRVNTAIKTDRQYHVALSLFLIAIFIPYVSAKWDPYDIIGVKHDANLDQIKKAYREQAIKLHPDKSNLSGDEANRRFIELNKAFSILKDPERKNRYDQYGGTEESRPSRPHHTYQYDNRQTWTQNGFRTFTFFASSDGILRKKSISSKQYYNEYLKESKYRPFFIFFYADFCPSCSLIENTWAKITEELAKYNIGSFTINVHHESRLSQELGVTSIPHIACLIDGQIKPYHQSELSLGNIVRFTKTLLPNNLANLLRTESEQDRFISLGPQQNKLSVLIINNEPNLKLRYLLLAFELRQYYRFAHVSTKQSDYQLLSENYNFSIDSKSKQTFILVFGENIKKPVFTIDTKTDNLDIIQLKKKLLRWPFLTLPRVSSQQKFDDLCVYTIPRDGDRTRPRLCVILFATNTPSSLAIRGKLIEFIEVNELMRDERSVFAFIDPIRQSEFVESLIAESENSYPFPTNQSIESAIILLERLPQSSRKARFRWLGFKWNPENMDELDRAKLELHSLISDYKSNHLTIQSKIALTLLIDEEGPSLVNRVVWRLLDYMRHIVHYFTSGESLSTIILLIICALITSFFLYQGPPIPSTRPQTSFMYNDPMDAKSETHTSNGTSTQCNPTITMEELNIVELKAETYNGMIRLLKPGYRSIVLLIDREAKDQLLPEFKKAVWPYRRNKTLLFGYLCLDKNLNWYKSLLQEILGIEDLNVNKKNCIGTVLSLNGFKKYLRVYHVKHKERGYYEDDADNCGSFLSFNEDDEEANVDGIIKRDDVERNNSSRDKACPVEDLLARLPIWLDKMFDGLTKRYFLNNWPEEMN